MALPVTRHHKLLARLRKPLRGRILHKRPKKTDDTFFFDIKEVDPAPGYDAVVLVGQARCSPPTTPVLPIHEGHRYLVQINGMGCGLNGIQDIITLSFDTHCPYIRLAAPGDILVAASPFNKARWRNPSDTHG